MSEICTKVKKCCGRAVAWLRAKQARVKQRYVKMRAEAKKPLFSGRFQTVHECVVRVFALSPLLAWPFAVDLMMAEMLAPEDTVPSQVVINVMLTTAAMIAIFGLAWYIQTITIVDDKCYRKAIRQTLAMSAVLSMLIPLLKVFPVWIPGEGWMSAMAFMADASILLLFSGLVVEFVNLGLYVLWCLCLACTNWIERWRAPKAIVGAVGTASAMRMVRAMNANGAIDTVNAVNTVSAESARVLYVYYDDTVWSPNNEAKND